MESIQVPKEIEILLLQILAESKEANLVLRGFIAGKELTGGLKLSGTFEIAPENIEQ